MRETPVPWRVGFALYRRRTGADSLGNETAWYADVPDEEIPDEEGIDFQSPRAWNGSGRVGSAGGSVADRGEVAGGVLEGYWRGEPEIAVFDRLEIDGALWEVRDIRRFPHHRQLVLQRVQ